MILADKITELRKKNGWSQEDLAGQLEVSRQSISKWESAQSTPDMNRILKMSEIFGVSTDYLLKDEMELPAAGAMPMMTADEDGKVRSVSMEEASAFLTYKWFASGRIALGVLMCVLAPVLLIVLSGFQEAGILAWPETAATAVGLLVLLLLVSGAVAIFVTTGFRGRQFDYFEKEEIDTAYGVDGMVKDRRERYSQAYMMQLVIGILFCVLSVLPLFLAMLVFGENEAAETASTGILLILVAVGCFLIVRCSIVWGGFQMLLQEGDYTVEQKRENKKNEYIAAIYWGSAIALYLAVSFLTNDWQRTWIIWPVAGVAYGVVVAVARVLRRR